MPIKFGFRWIPFAATVLTVALGVALGQWQMRRAAAKEAIELELSARQAAPPLTLGAAPLAIDAAEYRRVQVKGEFLRDWPVYLDNRPYRGAAGLYVLMPLRIAGSDMHVLVARGWVRRDQADRTRLPPIATPAGLLEIQGTVRRNPGRLLQLGPDEGLHPGAIVQNLDIAQFEQASGLRLQPALIEQTGAAPDGLVRDWPRPSGGIAKHLGYAFQWYALATAALIFFVVTGFRRATK